jgi:hypothetical protein
MAGVMKKCRILNGCGSLVFKIDLVCLKARVPACRDTRR